MNLKKDVAEDIRLKENKMAEWIEFIYRDVLENAPIIEEGTNYFIVDWGQPEQLVVSKDQVIRKYETEDK